MSDSPGFFGRLKARLSRSTAKLSDELRSLFRGRRIDAELLEDLETRLITADVGAEATTLILQDLRARVARQELGDVEALLNALRDDLAQILAPCAQPLRIDRAHKPYVVMVVGDFDLSVGGLAALATSFTAAILTTTTLSGTPQEK